MLPSPRNTMKAVPWTHARERCPDEKLECIAIGGPEYKVTSLVQNPILWDSYNFSSTKTTFTFHLVYFPFSASCSPPCYPLALAAGTLAAARRTAVSTSRRGQRDRIKPLGHLGPPTTSGEASFYWLSVKLLGTGTSDFPTFTLESGALIPQPDAAKQGQSAWDMAVEAGKYIEFMVTNAGAGGDEATPYCAVSDASGYATLAVNGVSNGFSMCATANQNYILVFQASATNDGSYQYSTCQPQNIHLVQA
ncbi:uncharacterized protein B0H18DRAFT_1213626 [Fomitopsis serialis]|uniref:uncharacterized protein n=1 Tax=Fomitopsis serialis TaxID=139415 RepID=UPI002008A6E6|nr:uncharacterized protein B0H18DRAFT_1213626 [Neoantrodia serialis]KAH9919817.1 hypothetical protein B0H18DRAFT_1213626 [Neoantrodia serialis]